MVPGISQVFRAARVVPASHVVNSGRGTVIRIEPKQVEAFCIYGAHALDPITVMLQDFGTGSGKLVIECYGEAWAAYWGAMGEDNIREFVTRCDTDYIVGKLKGTHQSNGQHFRDYTYRIVTAVKEALKNQACSSLETGPAPEPPAPPPMRRIVEGVKICSDQENRERSDYGLLDWMDEDSKRKEP